MCVDTGGLNPLSPFIPQPHPLSPDFQASIITILYKYKLLLLLNLNFGCHQQKLWQQIADLMRGLDAIE